MKRTLAFGGAVAGILAYAAVAAPAAHADSVPAVNLAATNFAAQQVAAFWYAEGAANLVNATPYAVETTVSVKHSSTVPKTPATTKPGLVGSSGDQKASTATAKNVNLPRTVGKVFFIGADGKPHWCTGTAVQGRYKNLVATAGHCVYDTKSNKATLDKWVFVPGYYQGKTPWGIYVGKTAYTHYDFSVYEDGDRNYAFVTVYNGVQVTDVKTDKVKNWVDNRVFEDKASAEKARQDLVTKYTGWAGQIVPQPDPAHLAASRREAVKGAITPAKLGELTGNTQYNAENLARVAKGEASVTDPKWGKFYGLEITRISRKEYPGEDGWKDAVYYFKKDNGWYKATLWALYDVDYKLRGKIVDIALKDVGRLGDNVGGQGLAYNQKLGAQPVFVFGYPSGSHPDGNYAFTGKTLKWSYGKPSAYQAPAEKAENLQGIRSSFTGQGALGSAWLLKYSNATRLGYLNGVTIGVADTDGNERYDTSVSPYFDGETLQVYQAAEKNWSGKIV